MLKNIPAKLVSAVFKTTFRPRFIGSFKVLVKKGQVYKISLSHKLRMHPVFNVGLFKPYWDLSHVDWESLAPRKLALPQAVASESGRQAEPPPGIKKVASASRRALIGTKRRKTRLHVVKLALVLN